MGSFITWILLKLASSCGLESDLHRSGNDTKKPVLGYQYLYSPTEQSFKEKELKCKKLKRKDCNKMDQNGISQHIDELVLVQSVQAVTRFAFNPERKKTSS